MIERPASVSVSCIDPGSEKLWNIYQLHTVSIICQSKRFFVCLFVGEQKRKKRKKPQRPSYKRAKEEEMN